MWTYTTLKLKECTSENDKKQKKAEGKNNLIYIFLIIFYLFIYFFFVTRLRVFLEKTRSHLCQARRF